MNDATSDTSDVTSDEVVARAAALRPLLLGNQEATEALRYPTRDVFDAIVAAGLFNILKPKLYGGYELPLQTFYKVIMELARGCPNTGWWFALGAGHAVQIASYLPKQAQDEIFGYRPNFQAPWSFGVAKPSIVPVAGGYRVSGTWYYASGIPYASHFMGSMPAPAGSGQAGLITVVIPEGGFVRLDNWGDLLGMKGSGSQGATVDDVFVPEHMTFPVKNGPLIGKTPGGAMHGNPMYNGNFTGFAECGLAAMAVGTGYAALDEYEELLATKNTPGSSVLRGRNPDYLRSMGMAVAMIDMARAATLNGSDQYIQYATEALRGKAAFDDERCLRLDGIYHQVEATIYEALQLLIRTASSATLKDGARIPRYLLGVLMLVSRGHDQFEFRAADIGRMILTRKRGFNYSEAG